MCARCDALEADLSAIRAERNAEITADDIAAIQSALGLAPIQSRILLLLYKSPRIMSAESLCVRACGEGVTAQSARVHISQIRMMTGANTIRTHRPLGYSLTPEGRDKVTRVLRERTLVVSAAVNDDASTPLPVAIALLVGKYAHGVGLEATASLLSNIHRALALQYGKTLDADPS